MSKRKLIKLIIILVIFNLCFSIGVVYAQNKINITVLPFENVSNNTNYAFLGNYIPNSINTYLNLVSDINTIPSTETVEYAEKFGLDSTTLQKMSVVLRFAIKSEVNTIVIGRFIIDEQTGMIIVSVFVYSIAQRGIILAKQYENFLDDDMFSFVDNIALNIKDEIDKKKEEIEEFIDEMMSNTTKPNYTTKLTMKEAIPKGIPFEWETDKETTSILYLGTEPDFNIDSSIASFEDESIDGLTHRAVVTFDAIGQQEKYYLKASDTDFLDNSIVSEETSLLKSEVDKITDEIIYEIMEELSKHIDEMNYKRAFSLCSDANIIINKYEHSSKTYEEVKAKVDNLLPQLEKASQLNNLFIKLKRYINENTFEKAMPITDEIISEITKTPIEDVITIKEMETLKTKLDIAIKVQKVVLKGDVFFKEGEYGKARDNYNNALSLIKKNSIDDLISVIEIENKLRKIFVSLDTHISLSVGAGLGYGSLINFYNGIIPGWSVELTIRPNRIFSLGLGVDFLYAEVFAKFSPINTIGFYPISSELYIRPEIKYGFIPPLGLTIGASIGYILYFDDVWGIYFDASGDYDFFGKAYYFIGEVGVIFNF